MCHRVLHQGVFHARTDIIRFFVRQPAFMIRYIGWHVRAAARDGNLAVAQCLMREVRYMNVKACGGLALRTAAKRGHLHIVQWLVQHVPCIDVHEEDKFAIKQAAANGHMEIVLLLNTLQQNNKS